MSCDRIFGGPDWDLYEYERARAALPSYFRASEEELAQAARRVAEADAILGLARTELSRCNPVFPELHDDLPF